MGLAGKHPLNANIKALNGVRASRMGTTRPGQGKPVKPSNLSKYEGKFWDETVQRLIDREAVTDLDQTALEQLAHWYDVYETTRLALSGADYSTTGTARLLTANGKAFDAFRRLAVHFGLTPLARNSVAVNEAGDIDEDDMLK